MYSNKKGISEVVSFVLIVALITILSSTAYFFAKTNIDEQVSKFDRNNMEIYVKRMAQKIDSIKNFDTSTTSISVSFKKGILIFEDNTAFYNSQVPYSGSNVCFNNICYQANEGYETILYNLTNGYYFSQNISLTPGSYLLTFENNKNESKIIIKFQ